MTDTPPPAAAPDGADPSMEDILASIRRILNEEEAPAVPVPEPTETVEDTPEDDDVLLLDPSMMVAGDPEPEVAEPEPEQVPVAVAAPVEPPRPVVVQAAPPVAAEAPEPQLTLLAPETAAAAASSVDNLVRTLSAGRATQVYSGGPTLEDIVRAELRPLLKEWLDAYLPPIVERLVRTEIERVVGRTVP